MCSITAAGRKFNAWYDALREPQRFIIGLALIAPACALPMVVPDHPITALALIVYALGLTLLREVA